MTDYLPHFEDNLGNRWEVLSLHFCVDFGGRQCHIETQRNNGDGKYPAKTFVIYYLDQKFIQWDHEECVDVLPLKGKLYDLIMAMEDEMSLFLLPKLLVPSKHIEPNHSVTEA